MLPVLAGLAGYLMSNPRRRQHRRRRNPGDTAKFLRRNLREAMQPLWALEAAVVTAKREHDDRALYIVETAIKALKTTAKNLKQAERIAWDAVVALETQQNPKRRKTKKVRRVKTAKGKWKTVTTITKTVKRQKVNPRYDFHDEVTAIVSSIGPSDAEKVQRLEHYNGLPKEVAEALVAGYHRWRAAHPNKHVRHFTAQLRRETR